MLNKLLLTDPDIQENEQGRPDMEEREKICILCGRREVMPGYICTACQDRIQQEAMGRRSEMRKEAYKAMTKYGINPEEEKE